MDICVSMLAGGSLPNADYEITGGGTLYLVMPLNNEAKTFLYDRLGDEAQFLGDAVAVEHRGD